MHYGDRCLLQSSAPQVWCHCIPRAVLLLLLLLLPLLLYMRTADAFFLLYKYFARDNWNVRTASRQTHDGTLVPYLVLLLLTLTAHSLT